MGDDPRGAPGLDALIGRIEEIARRLDSDSIGLDEALALFEEGVGHLGRARETLARAELRIQELVGPAGESIREIDPSDGRKRDGGERPASPSGRSGPAGADRPAARATGPAGADRPGTGADDD